MTATTEETQAQTVEVQTRMRNRWNLDPNLSEADKRKERRRLRAELAKAREAGQLTPELEQKLASSNTVTITPKEQSSHGTAEGDEEPSSRSRSRKKRAQSAISVPAFPKADLTEVLNELRSRLEENDGLETGYLFSLGDEPTAGALISKFTQRWGHEPTQFRVQGESNIMMGPVPENVN